MLYFASDVHWQPARDQDSDRDATGAFGRFLSDLAGRVRGHDEPVSLYVLGDLFDFWWERGDRILACYEPHVRALGRATKRGVRITVLFGNRDFTMGEALTRRTGVEIAGDRAEVEARGRRICLQHGDLLCTDDHRYQRYRRVIRSAPVRALMRLVPVSRIEAIVERMRRASRAEIDRKPADSMNVVDDAVTAELARGFDVVVCGHVHVPQQRVIGDGELVVLGPWDHERGWYATADIDRDVELHEYP